MVDQRRFRDVMGHFATGVTLVTARGSDGRTHGLTVNAVASVSLDPPLVLVCIDRSGQSHDRILAAEHFGVSILDVGGEELARRFSHAVHDDRFDGVEFRREVTGSPILTAALAWLDCRIDAVHPAGDHSVVLGEVLACGARDGEPLAFFRGEYGRVNP